MSPRKNSALSFVSLVASISCVWLYETANVVASPAPPKMSKAYYEQEKFETKLGAALVFYRDGKVSECEKRLRTILQATTDVARRQQIIGYLALIKYDSGDHDAAATLFAQATANRTVPIHSDVLLRYQDYLRSKGLKKQVEALDKLADKFPPAVGTCTMSKDGTLRLVLHMMTPSEYSPSSKDYLSMLGHVGPLKAGGSDRLAPPWSD